MRVLLVNPPYHPEGYVVGRGRFVKYIVNLVPPLGLLSLAAVLERDGHQVAIADATLGTVDDVVRRAREFEPGLIGITATTPAMGSALTTAAALKAAAPATPLVLGGAHLSAVPADLAEFTPFALGVIGEGEETLRAVAAAAAAGRPLTGIPGTAWREGTMVQASPRPRLADLDALPALPAYRLIPPLREYYPTVASYRRLPLATVMTSRGCPAPCTFCDRAVFGETIRRRSVGHVLEEITRLIGEHGAREIRFFDDTFTFHREWVLELCAELPRRFPGLPWTCLTRVDRADPALLAAMRRAGCWQVLFGFETGDPGLLARLKKGTTVEQNRAAARAARAAGLEVRGDFLVGTPGETRASLAATLDFAIGEKLALAHFNKFIPFPGTDLYREQYTARGARLTWRDYGSIQDLGRIYAVPEGMDRDEYVRMLRGLTRRFYLRPGYLLGRLAALRTPTQARGALLGALGMLQL